MTKPEIPPSGTACSFVELSDLVSDINESWKERWKLENPGHCFRGMDAHSYDLNPGLLRSPYPEKLEDLARLENSLWVDFRLRSKPLLGHHVQNAWEALLTMQQHGFPTRLLDWSKNLAVATYFSVRNIDEGQDGAIWIMASRRLMELRGVPDAWRTAVGDPALESMGVRENQANLASFNEQLPAPVAPDQFVQRMIVQQGIYTLHTFKRYALEQLAITDAKEFGSACFIHKVAIPSCAKESIRSELSLLTGIGEDTLFPDLDGFARSFVMEQKRLGKRSEGPVHAVGRFFGEK